MRNSTQMLVDELTIILRLYANFRTFLVLTDGLQNFFG
jgi:hypothetical protein